MPHSISSSKPPPPVLSTGTAAAAKTKTPVPVLTQNKTEWQPHACTGEHCCPAGKEKATKAVAKTTPKSPVKQYTVEDVNQNKLNKLGRFLIRYGYQWPTRKLPGLSHAAQQGISKCGCRIHGPSQLSCSEFSYRAFEVLPAPWALAQMCLRNFSCIPLTTEGPIAKLLEEPLPFNDFIKKAKTELRGKPLVDLGDAKDWALFAKGASQDVLKVPGELLDMAREKLTGKRRKEAPSIPAYEEKGDPGPCEALFNLNIRRWYYQGKTVRAFKPKQFEGNTRLNPWKIEPD